MIAVQFEPNLNSWRTEARKLLQSDTPPELISWSTENDQALFLFDDPAETKNFSNDNSLASTSNLLPLSTTLKVPPEFLTLARFVSCSNNPDRWSLLYRLLYRLKHETSDLLKIAIDIDVRKAQVMMKSVTRDIHKMHAFVRFKCVKSKDENQEIYIAWHRPEHFIVQEAAAFFVRRFGDKPWCILTPERSAYWDLKSLRFGDGVPQHLFQVEDDFEKLWKTYYSSIFNPARLKIKAMKAEMAPKYWSTLPEAELIHDLIRSAPQRLQQMVENQNLQAVVPKVNSLLELNSFAKNCQACPLFKQALHVVCGEGPAPARLMIVGEQPGDHEDIAGKPFIGPAGELLNAQLKIAGIDRENIYVTNAVKHFKFERVGNLRKHKKPTGTEMHACRPWLEEEIKFVKPKVILALGLTAATSLLGRLPKITQERGQIIRDSSFADVIIISWHPAAILRSMDPIEAAERKAQLAMDLKLAADQSIQ